MLYKKQTRYCCRQKGRFELGICPLPGFLKIKWKWRE
jgi:hypothetical protein